MCRAIRTLSPLLCTVLLVLLGAMASAPVAEAKVIRAWMYSPANQREIQYCVYTPPGYSAKSATLYPVAFSLHGKNSSARQRSTTYARTLDARITSGELLPMIWVFPEGQSNSFYGNAYDGHKQVYSNIIGELVTLIDASYKTIGTREFRALEGFSMGGFGAGLLAATDPDLFGATAVTGPVAATWPDMLRKQADVALEMYNNVEENWLPYSLYDQTGVNAPVIALTVQYKLIVGDQDSQLKGTLKFRDFLIANGIEPNFQLLPGVTHTQSMYLEEGSGLRFLSDYFAGVAVGG